MIDTKETSAVDAESPENKPLATTDSVAEPATAQDSSAAAQAAAVPNEASPDPEAKAPAEPAAKQGKAKAPVPAKYRHFKHLSPRSHQWIEKNCGAWVLEAMRNYLFDPDRVFPDWGTRFAVTLKDIGREEVERMGEAEVLYDYVLSSPFWEINYQIRKRLMATKPARKRGQGKGRQNQNPNQNQNQNKTHQKKGQGKAQSQDAKSVDEGDRHANATNPAEPATPSSATDQG